MTRACVALVGAALIVVSGRARADDCSVVPCDRPLADEPRSPDPTQPAAVIDGRVEVGGAYKRLYDIPFYGVDAKFGIGRAYEGSAWFIEGGVFRGRSENGLSTLQFRLNVALEARFDRVSLGLEIRLSLLRIDRATGGEAMEPTGVGVRPYLGADLVRWEGGRALTASLGFDTDVYANVLWGPSLHLGARF